MSATGWWFELPHSSLVLPFLGTGMRIDFFQSCGHCWVFQICWHTEHSTLVASSFRILNSSAGIPLPPLALLTAVLPKDHLTSHSRTSGSGWMTTPSRLSGSFKIFFYSSSVYSFHLFLISSASIRSLPFLSFMVLAFEWHAPLIVPMILKRSLVLPFLSFSSISLHCSLKKAFLFLLAIFCNPAFRWVYLPFLPCFLLLFFL